MNTEQVRKEFEKCWYDAQYQALARRGRLPFPKSFKEWWESYKSKLTKQDQKAPTQDAEVRITIDQFNIAINEAVAKAVREERERISDKLYARLDENWFLTEAEIREFLLSLTRAQ